MNFLLLPEISFLAHESFLGRFSTIIFNTCKIGKMLRAPPHLLDHGYAPALSNSWAMTLGTFVNRDNGCFKSSQSAKDALLHMSFWCKTREIRELYCHECGICLAYTCVTTTCILCLTFCHALCYGSGIMWLGVSNLVFANTRSHYSSARTTWSLSCIRILVTLVITRF